ncbi:PDZ domain-containing protein [Dermacoccus nishinomiyaensis]|uniref:PDZ domain-containing protein n=1 Tax=Dermacoccus nishinomiyaensis TaxID=1274 RepID=UPI0033A6C70A
MAVVPSSSLRGASDTGVVVQQVLNGSAVASTGMTAGDTITALDGKAVTSTDSLSSLMGTRYPGSTIKVTWSDTSGASHTASVTLQKSTAN